MPPDIVGLVLVRNEDIHLERVVENIAAFCDRILVADHASTDRTPEILRALAARHPHLALHPITHPRESHDLIAELAGTDTWIFGVDGDEIYDPAGLAQLRHRLRAGEFAKWWMILGNVLHCDLVDPVARRAAGWLAPPCRSVTKLYNFAAANSWLGVRKERLHGGQVIFKPSHHASARLDLHEQIGWEDSPFRCLHACFVPRSSGDPADIIVRPNIMETHASGAAALFARWRRKLLGRTHESDWKRERYARGARVTIDASSFFP